MKLGFRKAWFIIMICCAGIIGCQSVNTEQNVSTVNPVGIIPKGLDDSVRWLLAWQDEFDGPVLDKEIWSAEVNDHGGGNQELQYYTDRSKNVYVEDGLLNIVGYQEQYLTREYTSARLTSTISWTYGRFEIRAKLPEGQGIWPAIWLRAAGEPYGAWPASGEIDIMEMIGSEPDVIYGTLHYGSTYPENESSQGTTVLTTEGFHVFALEWDVDEIRWYIDDIHYLTLDTWHTTGGAFPAPFNAPFNIVLNLAIGGVWPGSPDESTEFPQKLIIDYVRVYQKVMNKTSFLEDQATYFTE